MKDRIKSIVPFVGLALLFLALSLLTDKFLTTRNLANVLRRSAPVVIMATGMTFVIVSGGIDLSVGSVLALAGVCGTMAISRGIPLSVALGCGGVAAIAYAAYCCAGGMRGFWRVASVVGIAIVDGMLLSLCLHLAAGTPVGLAGGILVALLIGASCGMANGILSVGLRIPPFIATLGMMGIVRGSVLILTDGVAVTDNLPPSFERFGTDGLFGVVPWQIIVMLGVVLLGAWTMRCTPLGRYAYAIGSNREAAYHSGIPVSRYSVVIYTLAGCLTGLAGIMTMAYLDGGQPTEGAGMELTVIAAVVIGGGSLSGGEGNIIGAVVGALLMAVLLNGCVLLGVSPYVQQLVIGALIVAAVALDQYLRRRGMAE
ncbi:MAG: ABC transporter permease [Planctomycetota bacterium]